MTMTTPIYLVGDELYLPGCDGYEFLDGMANLTLKDQRKMLSLLKWVAAGGFDILQTTAWTDEQRRAFVRSLPETFVGIEEGV